MGNDPRKEREEDSALVEAGKRQDKDEHPTISYPNPRYHKPLIPFHRALQSQIKKPQSNCLLELFKEATIMIPLANEIQKVPSYSKFFKELSTTSKKQKRVQISKNTS